MSAVSVGRRHVDLMETERDYALLLPHLLRLLASEMAVKSLVMMRTALLQLLPPRGWCAVLRKDHVPQIQMGTLTYQLLTCSHHQTMECILYGSLSQVLSCVSLLSV